MGYVDFVFNKGFKPRTEIKWDEEKATLIEDLKNKAKGFVIHNLKTEIYNKIGQNVDDKDN